MEDKEKQVKKPEPQVVTLDIKHEDKPEVKPEPKKSEPTTVPAGTVIVDEVKQH